MNRLILAAGFVLMLSFSCNTGEKKSNESLAKTDKPAIIEFEKTEHDFGLVEEGEKVGWYFKFTNRGGSDLLIHNASATCGCTVPEYSRKPIPSGNEGVIRVVFDSKGRSGKQNKSVTVESNAEERVIRLLLKAEIISNTNQ